MVVHQTFPRVIVVLCMLVACSIAATTNHYLNATMIPSCYTSLNAGCSFTDPNLWDNLDVPTLPNSRVFLTSNVNDSTPVTLRLTNTSIIVLTLSISGPITLEVVDGALAEATNMTLIDMARLVVKPVSTVMFNGTVILDSGADIYLEERAEYIQNAGWLRLSNTSAVIASTNATLSIANGNITGDLLLDANTIFNADALYIKANQNIPARVNINNLYIRAVGMTLSSGGNINNINAQGSNLLIDTNAQVATLSVSFTSGVLDVYGSLLTQNLTASLTAITVYGSGSLKSPLISTQSSTLTMNSALETTTALVDGGAWSTQGLTATELVVRSSGVVNVANLFGISAKLNITNGTRLNLKSVSASINSTSLGRGDISINASSIYLNSSYNLPNSKLTFIGANSIVLPTAYIYDFAYGDNPSLQILALKGLVLNQSITFPGSLTVVGSLTATGVITTTGSVSLTQVAANVQGSFAPLGGLTMNSTTFSLGANSLINSTTVYIGANTTFINLAAAKTETTNINAQVVNTGEIQMNANSPIAIVGKYTQMKSGTLTINKLNRGLPAIVTVVGTANVAGTLAYQPLVIASGETVKLPIIATTGGLQGKFNDPSRGFERHLYEALNVYVVFSETGGAGALHPVTWAVVFVVLASLLL